METQPPPPDHRQGLAEAPFLASRGRAALSDFPRTHKRFFVFFQARGRPRFDRRSGIFRCVERQQVAQTTPAPTGRAAAVVKVAP